MINLRVKGLFGVNSTDVSEKCGNKYC